MRSPKVNFCVVCEGVRPELHGKANVLGFYGVLPDVTITVLEIEKNVPVLMFLVGLRGESDEAAMSASILKPDRTLLAAHDGQVFPPLPEKTSGLAGFAFASISFKQTGIFHFVLSVNGEEKMSQPFTIETAESNSLTSQT